MCWDCDEHDVVNVLVVVQFQYVLMPVVLVYLRWYNISQSLTTSVWQERSTTGHSSLALDSAVSAAVQCSFVFISYKQ